MTTTAARHRLGDLLGEVGVPGSFTARRTTAADDLEIEISGLGPLRFPISRKRAAELCRIARPARYGKGEQTLLDRQVRDTGEIPRSRIEIDQRRWNRTLTPVLDALRADLGLPDGCRLKPRLHSMLVYAPGQFFLPHRDSEKTDAMAGTLVVTLPSRFKGGALVVEQGGEQVTCGGSAKELTFFAFYADCIHEVQAVEEGYRIVLTYDLLLQGDAVAAAEATPATVETVSELLREHFETPLPPRRYAIEDRSPREPPNRLVYLLDHRYTERGFAWRRLKGNDASRAALLAQAAERAGCETVLALAELHEIWDCMEPGWEEAWQGRHRRWSRDDEADEWLPEHEPEVDDPEAYELVDLIDSEISLERWVEPSAAKPTAVTTFVTDDEVCATTPTDELAPYASEYEGYMGNYGNTMDRWYRRAAVVVWPREHAFAVRAEASPTCALEELQRRLRAGETVEARQMVATLSPFWRTVAAQQGALLGEALRVAVGLGEPALAAALLEPFGVEALNPAAAPAWAAAVERYGEAWARTLLAAWTGQGPTGLGSREQLEWIATLPRLCEALVASDDDAAAPAARLLLEDAWRRLRASIELGRDVTPPRRRAEALAALEAPILGLFGGTAVAAADDLSDEAVTFLCTDGNEQLVPTLVQVLRAAAKVAKPAAPTAVALDALAQCCTRRLEARLERPARGEDDWSIALPPGCDCELCATLGAFLADPDTIEHEWPLAKEGRKHVHRRLEAGELPVFHETLRSGRPYTLVLTKTRALFDDEAQQRRTWGADLKWLARRTARGRPRRA